MNGENKNNVLNKKNNNEPNIISLDLSKDPEFAGISPSNKKSDIDPDTIVVQPILDKKKLTSYINNFSSGLKFKNNPERAIERIGEYDFEEFKQWHNRTSFFNQKEILTDDALNSIYNGFRDYDAEENKRNKLKANYLLNKKQEEALKLQLNDGPASELYNNPEIVVNTSGKYNPDPDVWDTKRMPAPWEVGESEDIKDILKKFPSTGSLDITKNKSNLRIEWEVTPMGRRPFITWEEHKLDPENVRLFNEGEVWQNSYKFNTAKSNSNNPEWDYSFSVNGALGDAIQGLGIEFILSGVNDAEEMFNKKFRHFGLRAEAKSVKPSPFAHAIESLVIYDAMDNVLFEQKVYGDVIAGIDKSTMIDALGTPLGDDPSTYGTIIRPEFYTKALSEFKINLNGAARNNSPIASLGAEYTGAETNKMFVLRDHFYEMTELPTAHNRMIVNIGQSLGVDIKPSDMFDLNKSLAGESLYDPQKVMKFLSLIRDKVRAEDDSPVEEIDLSSLKSLRLDKQGGLIDQLQYAFDFGVNNLDGLNLIMDYNASLNDVFIDSEGNKHTKRDILTKVLDYYSTEIRGAMNTASKNVGMALRMNDNWKTIPLEGPGALVAFQFLEEIGMNVHDHFVTQGISIDGRPSSYMELYNIVTDPSLNSEARLGEIDIKVGNPSDYGVIKPIIERAQQLLERQETNFEGLFGYKNKFVNGLDLGYEWFENLVQGVGIELLDIGGSVKEIGKDVMRTMGVNVDFMPPMSILNPAVPGLSLFNSFDKRFAENLREEFLPEWSTRISDSDNLGEFLFLANEPFATSAPYLGAFMVNPYLGVSLVGVNSYGENLYNFRNQRESLVNMENAGISLTETEINLMESGDWKLRALAGGNASIETAMTAAFTMRYLKGFDFLKRTKLPKDLKSTEAITKMARDFQFRFDKTFYGRINQLWGIEGRAMAFELMEENNIALWQYVFESAMGVREFDIPELGKLLKDTSYTTAFSSLGMSSAVRLQGNSNLNASVNLTIENNIGNANFYKLVDQKINIQDALNKYVKTQREDGKSNEQIEKSDFFVWAKGYLKGLNTEISTIEKNRADLVSNLTQENKIRFLDLLKEITIAENIINSDIKNQTAKQAAYENLQRYKGELAEIVNDIQSAGAFEFLPFNEKSKYIDAAYREVMNDEEILTGETNQEGDLGLTYKSGEKLSNEDFAKLIEEKALELYLNDIEMLKNENIDPIPLDILPAPGFGWVNPKDVYDIEIDPNFSRDFDLKKQIEIGTNRLLDAQINLEFIDKLESNQETDAPVDEKKTISNVNLELKAEIETILEKIKKYNIADNNELLNDLPEGDKALIIKFFETLNTTEGNVLTIDKGRFPIQRINAVLDAYGIAVELASSIDAPLDIFPEGEPFAITINGKTVKVGWKKLIGDLLRVYSGDFGAMPIIGPFLPDGQNAGKRNIATLDVLKQLLIRDKNKAGGFLSLYENILQKHGEVTLRNQGLYNELLDIYNTGRGVNTDRRSPLSFWLVKEKRPVQIADDYEMSLLSGLARINLDSNDPNGEFNRYKRNVLEELELRKQEYENSPSKYKSIYKGRYEYLKAAVDKLGLVNAVNYSEIVPNASKHNLDVVTKIRELYKEREESAKNRVYGFGQKWTNFDNYMPLFVRPSDLDASTLDEMQYEDPTANKAGTWSTSGALQYATVPDSYIQSGFRMNFGDYMKNSFHALKSSDLDATARQDVMTLYNLFNSPLFKKQFSNSADFDMFKSLFGDYFLKEFNAEVNKGRNPFTDYGDANLIKPGIHKTKGMIDKFNETTSTILSVGSATALASLTQPTQQYYSAISNNMQRVKSPAARGYLQNKAFLFMFGLSQASNGTKASNYASKLIQDVFGEGDKSNIYAKSQTSLRNAITAELPLDKTTKRDISYYAGVLNIDLGIFGKYGVGGAYTYDAFLNRLQQNSELALEVFLARADKAAANASFEAHYIDYKINNGAVYPKNSEDRKAWWAKENENPDIGAINYADAIVKELMRPSGELSEAGIFKASQSWGVKTVIRTLYPYHKFQLNAKTNFWTQYTIANDPNVPEPQRLEATAAMNGILTEVGTFQAMKIGLGATLYGTLPQVLFGFDDEEIERIGGLNKIISQIQLPIEDPVFMKNFKQELQKAGVSAENMNSIEAVNAYVKAYMRGELGDDTIMAIDELADYGMTYNKKVNLTPKNNNVAQAIVQDLITTFNPFPTPQAMNTGVFALINHVSQENNLTSEPIFLEYASEDLFSDKLTPGQKVYEYVSENLGLFGIVAEQGDKVIDALRLMDENKIIKTLPGGITTTQYAGYGQELINQRLDKTIGMLAVMRILIATGGLPTGPSAEITRYLDRVERGIERYITTSKSPVSGESAGNPDSKMKVGWSRYWETLEEQEFKIKKIKEKNN
tara:strand:+ start:1811 stop:9022 length:7212 start_codon:yes stop_codon:yes gene_type:complete